MKQKPVKCRANDCGFWVTTDDKFCPNCGIWNPTKISTDSSLTKILNNPTENPLGSILFYCVLFFLLILLIVATGGVACGAVGLILLLLKWLHSPPKEQLLATNTLRYRGRIITQRIDEISKRKKQIHTVLNRMKEHPEEITMKANPILTDSLNILDKQRNRYEQMLVESRLVQLQNQLSPFLFNDETDNYESIEKKLNELDNLLAEGLSILDLAKSHILSNTENIIWNDLQTRTEETLTSARKLRMFLVNKQATVAVRGIVMIEGVKDISMSIEEIIKSETFNIQVGLTDFSDSFTELEAEYCRLRNEEHIIQLLQ